MTIDHDEIAALLRRLLPAMRGRTPRRIEYLPGGYSHRNYRIEIDAEAFALRICAAGRAPDARERRYLEIAVAPEVAAYDAASGHLLTRWIDGPALADAPMGAEEAGRFVADLHRRIPVGVRRYGVREEVAALLRQALEGDLPPAERRRAKAVAAEHRRLDWKPAQRRGCHNDLNPWNVLRPPAGGLRVLDWETAGDNDPLFDLAGLHAGLGWSFEQALTALAAYRAAAPLRAATPARLRATIRAFQAREYAWAAAQMASGNDRAEVVRQAETMAAALLAG